MPVRRFLCEATGQLPADLKTILFMFMIFFADQSGSFRITIIRMLMSLRGFRTDQFTPFQSIAILRMGMYFLSSSFRHYVTAALMLMNLYLRQRAPELSVFVVTGCIVMMNHKIRVSTSQIAVCIITACCVLMDVQCFGIADRHCLLNSVCRCITLRRMGVFRDIARFLFQRDRRHDQGIDRAEYHHTGKTGYHFIPSFSLLMCLCELLRILKIILIHIRFTILPFDACPLSVPEYTNGAAKYSFVCPNLSFGSTKADFRLWRL